MPWRSSEGRGYGPGANKDAVVVCEVEARISQEVEADATMTKPKILAEKLLREPPSFRVPLDPFFQLAFRGR